MVSERAPHHGYPIRGVSRGEKGHAHGLPLDDVRRRRAPELAKVDGIDEVVLGRLLRGDWQAALLFPSSRTLTKQACWARGQRCLWRILDSPWGVPDLSYAVQQEAGMGNFGLHFVLVVIKICIVYKSDALFGFPEDFGRRPNW